MVDDCTDGNGKMGLVVKGGTKQMCCCSFSRNNLSQARFTSTVTTEVEAKEPSKVRWTALIVCQKFDDGHRR